VAEKSSGRLAFLGSVPKRGTKDIVDEAREAFAAYRGLGRDIIDDLIATLIEARQTIANMVSANIGMASERDHALSEADAAIKQRDEWMARQMDASLQRDDPAHQLKVRAVGCTCSGELGAGGVRKTDKWCPIHGLDPDEEYEKMRDDRDIDR
jgi:hypothetical protein